MVFFSPKGSGIEEYTDFPSFPRRRESTTTVDPRFCGDDDGKFLVAATLSSWPYEIEYFWLIEQVLCKAQRREHSELCDRKDAGGRAKQEARAEEQLPRVSEQGVRNI